MAINKTKKFWIAAIHSFFYTIPFVFLCTINPIALFIIMITHAIEDYFYLVKHWISFKNKIGLCYKLHGQKIKDEIDEDTGAVDGTPDWIAYPMLWIQDNVIHLLINAIAIYYFG